MIDIKLHVPVFAVLFLACFTVELSYGQNVTGKIIIKLLLLINNAQYLYHKKGFTLIYTT